MSVEDDGNHTVAHDMMDWAHKTLHTNEWGAIAARHLFDDMFTANDAVSTAIQLTFTFETGFTNLQFLGMAADAMNVGDLDFGALTGAGRLGRQPVQVGWRRCGGGNGSGLRRVRAAC